MEEDFDLEPDKIINWAVKYSSYEDLEVVAKALYGIYVIQRKRKFPKEHRKAKQLKKKYNQRKLGL